MASPKKDRVKALFKKGQRCLVRYPDQYYAAVVLRARKTDDGYFYLIHYDGWSKKHDEEVHQADMVKFSAELEGTAPEEPAAREASPGMALASGQLVTKRRRTDQLLAGVNPHAEIVTQLRLHVPASLKRVVLEDWRQVNQRGLFLPLPRPPRRPSVASILRQYEETAYSRLLAAAVREDPEAAPPRDERLAEVVDGLLQYFDRAVRHHLLYHQEVAHVADVLGEDQDVAKMLFWENQEREQGEGQGEGTGKDAGREAGEGTGKDAGAERGGEKSGEDAERAHAHEPVAMKEDAKGEPGAPQAPSSGHRGCNAPGAASGAASAPAPGAASAPAPGSASTPTPASSVKAEPSSPPCPSSRPLPRDVFGAEHLVRLLVKLPELVPVQHSSQAFVVILEDRLHDLLLFLAERKNAHAFFASPDEYAPNPDAPQIVAPSALLGRAARGGGGDTNLTGTGCATPVTG